MPLEDVLKFFGSFGESALMEKDFSDVLACLGKIWLDLQCFFKVRKSLIKFALSSK